MVRLLWKEGREQVWFALAAALSPLSVPLLDLLLAREIQLPAQACLLPAFLAFAIWGVAMATSERDAALRALPTMPVPEGAIRLAKSIPGLLTALVTGLTTSLAAGLVAFGGRNMPYGQASPVPAALTIAFMLAVVFASAFGLVLFLTRGSGVVRVLLSSRWIIGQAVVITGTVVGFSILLYGRKWDGETMIGPTDQAVRRSASALRDERSTPMLTDDLRMEEARRIASEVGSPNNAARAVYFLKGADALRAGLTEALAGREIGGAGTLPVYDTIRESVISAKSQMGEDQIARLEQASQIPSSLWAEFVYLDSKLAYHNINREVLSDRNVGDSVRDLAKNTEVAILNSRDITVAVRNREPRLAEILANALTASYKEQYDEQNHASAARSASYYTQQYSEASRRFAFAQAALHRFRRTNKDVFLPDQVTLALRDGDAIQSQIRDAAMEMAQIDARLKVKASYRRNPPELPKGKPVPSLTDERLRHQRETQSLMEARAAQVARLKLLRAAGEKQQKLIARLPEVNIQAQMLAAQLKAATERLQAVSRNLSAAREELAKTDAAGSLQVSYWAGPPPGTPGHPESPAFEGAVKRHWTMFWGAIFLSFVGSSAVMLALRWPDRGPVEIRLA